MKTVTVSEAEHKPKRKLDKEEQEFIKHFFRSLEDARRGRIRRVA